MTCRRITALMTLFLSGFLLNPCASAQEDEIVAGRVVGKIWHSQLNMGDSFDFMRKVQKAIGLEKGSPVLMMPPGTGRFGPPTISIGRTEADAPPPKVKGTILFLQTEPTPNLDASFAFESVGSHKEFLRRVRKLADRLGPSAELTGEEDRFELKLHLKYFVSEPPPETDENPEGGERQVRAFSIVIQAEGIGNQLGGAERPAPPQSISTYYRYVDGIMYASHHEIMQHVDLPSADQLQIDDQSAQNDLHADFDLSEIPIELKRAFWNALEASAGTWLQRFDNEALGEYSLRRSLGEGRLEIIRAGLFDVERVRFSLKLPQENETHVDARLVVTARDNSRLAQTLEQAGRQKSQLNALRDEEAPFALSSSLLVPEWAAPVATMIVESLRLRLRETVDNDGALSVLIDDLMKPLKAAVESRAFDAAVSISGDTTDGMVLRAGLRLPDAEQFLSSLETTLNVLPSQKFRASPITVGDYRGITVQTDEPLNAGEHLSVPVQMHLAATGSWLWITFGGEPAVAALADLVDQSENQFTERSEGVPLRIQFHLSRWLGDTHDEYSAVPQQALGQFERWLADVTKPRFQMVSMKVNGEAVSIGGEKDGDFTSYAGKLLTPENSDLDVAVRTFGRELTLDASVGTGVIYFAAAQYVAAQANMFRNMPIIFNSSDGEQPGRAQIRIGR